MSTHSYNIFIIRFALERNYEKSNSQRINKPLSADLDTNDLPVTKEALS